MANYRVKPPTSFKGEPGQDVEIFIKSFDIFCTASSIPTETKVSVIGNLLESDALSYYTILLKNTPTITWENFKIAFLAVFDSKDQYFLPEVELMSRVKLESESMASYFISKLALMDKLDVSMSNENKVKHLVNGLSADVRKSLPLRENLTIENFLQVTSSITDGCKSSSNSNQFTASNNHNVAYSSTHDELKDFIKATIRLTLEEGNSSLVKQQDVAAVETKGASGAITKPQCTICSKFGHDFRSCYHNPRNSKSGLPYNPYYKSTNVGTYKGRNYDPNYKTRVYNVNSTPSCEQCGHVNRDNNSQVSSRHNDHGNSRPYRSNLN